MTQHSITEKQNQTWPLTWEQVSWESPSNIALVKYWGKRDVQIPANPSVSFTLNNCKTTTVLKYKAKQAHTGSLAVYLDQERNEAFEPKIQTFLARIEETFPFVRELDFELYTSNSFPHSSGIASSASGMSALALCICSLAVSQGLLGEENFNQEASRIARLGSGSACRSVYSTLCAWGETPSVEDSHNEWGTPIPEEQIHPVFQDFQDTILLVDKGKKTVSSTTGHALMHDHWYADKRFEQAHVHMDKLLVAMQKGDLSTFTELVESEALTLHSMMMTSQPYFILFKPETIRIIEEIWAFRKQTGANCVFTLDAGANVHLLYPKQEKEQVLAFIRQKLVAFCENGAYICDEVGQGPKRLDI